MSGIVPDPDRRLPGADRFAVAAGLLLVAGILGFFITYATIFYSALRMGPSFGTSGANAGAVLGVGPLIACSFMVLVSVASVICGIVAGARGRALGWLWGILGLAPTLVGLALLAGLLRSQGLI